MGVIPTVADLQPPQKSRRHTCKRVTWCDMATAGVNIHSAMGLTPPAATQQHGAQTRKPNA